MLCQDIESVDLICIPTTEDSSFKSIAQIVLKKECKVQSIQYSLVLH